MTARILVIEDNQANLELMLYLLEAFGYTPITACDGETGIAAAIRERPDLIICDIQLPKLSGIDVARQVRAHPNLNDVPLVAVTAFAMVGDRDKLLAGGFDGYISKPIAPETFVRQIEEFLRSAEHASSFEPSTTQRRRILVVDNIPVNLSLSCSILEPMGYDVTTADDMAQALESARAARPDLILSDVHMANGSGFDFLQLAKADPLLRSIPFILITSTSCNERSRERGLALGACRFLFRPIEPLALLAEIEACLKEKAET